MDHLYFRIVIYFISVTFVCSQVQSVTTQTSVGKIVGKIKTIPFVASPYENVKEYLGIPFAMPPVKELRFSKPVPMTSLPSPFTAQSYGARCPQISSINATYGQDEDCLFLNVYVPDRPANDTSEPHAEQHAVMVWIYGGSFKEGDASIYDFSLLSLWGNIIVVTINYRVGVFGFLNTGDDDARGNYGLWDQRLAIKWVHDNIESFGGDNKRVTIAGESAGSMSVLQHAFNPENRNYFQRIIAQSGSMTMPIQNFERNGFEDTMAVADKLECETDSRDDLLKCLREKSVDEYLTALKEMKGTDDFGPVVDYDLITINPKHIAKESEERSLDEVDFFRSLDMLSGFNANEGAFMLSYIVDPTLLEYIQLTREDFKMYLPELMKATYRKQFTHEIQRLVGAQYTDWSNPHDFRSINLQIEKLMGDVNFGAPAIEMAQLHQKSSAARNFMYHFAPKTSRPASQAPSWVPGAGHADEIAFIMGAFGYLGIGEENAWENELIVKMMTYWSNFVKSGDPNSPWPVAHTWPMYNDETGDYLVLDKNMTDAYAKQYFYAEEANFWLDVFPDLDAAVREGGGGTCPPPIGAAGNMPINKTVTFVLAMIFFATWF